MGVVLEVAAIGIWATVGFLLGGALQYRKQEQLVQQLRLAHYVSTATYVAHALAAAGVTADRMDAVLTQANADVLEWRAVKGMEQ